MQKKPKPKVEKFFGIEMPSGSGIFWGSEDPSLSFEIFKGVLLWKSVAEPKSIKKKKRK